ncbi:MAG: glycosyltransferase [archaeon]
MNNKNLKVAIVHDWLTNFGGAERVIKVFENIFPQACIYTTVFDKKNMSKYFNEEKIVTSFIDKIPMSEKLYTKLLFLMPNAFESFNLTKYDIVLSSSSSCAKGIITGPNTMHISYIHTPMRYAWDLYYEYYNNANFITKFFMKRIIPNIRQWDVLNTSRIDYLIANSNYVRNRIKKYYRRNSEVIYPPVDTEFFKPINGVTKDYYLIVSRFVSYKRIDLAIKAFNNLGKRLIVVGSGEQEKKLKEIAKSNIIFTGRVSDKELMKYFQECKALIFPAREDFGIIPLEAQSCGKPVIAFGAGGALETVEHLKTGYLFKDQTVQSLQFAITNFEEKNYEEKYIREHAKKYSKERFIIQLRNYIYNKYKEFNEEKSKNIINNNIDFL